MARGCVHVKIKDGNITGVFCHLSDLPENGIIHLKANKVLTESEFIESHPQDSNELETECNGKYYDLGPESI